MTTVRSTPLEVTPPAEMHDALALVQRIGGTELLDKVITLFRASAEDRREKFAAAISEGDAHLASRIAHAMKGSAAQVGAEGLRAFSAQLEKEVESLDTATRQERYQRFIEELAAANAQLAAYRLTVVEAL